LNFLDQVSVLILTLNEAPNIGRTLDALAAFPEIVVLDSGSTDDTVAIVARFPNARLVARQFDTHAKQWNFGLKECGLERPWVLALDADYVLTAALVEEIARLDPPDAVSAYRASFHYCIHGRRLSGNLYPPVCVLLRRGCVEYKQFGHTQRTTVDGDVAVLTARIDHDDRKPLARWLSSQRKYAALEADYLLATPRTELRRTDRIRLSGWMAPLITPVYTLLVKRCVVDGWSGWYYTLQRTHAEILITLELIERRLRIGA
jgi:glycosyltransferase involved in cell wall biosynthesis